MRERPEISRCVCKMLHFRKWNEKLGRILRQIAPLGFAPGKSLDALYLSYKQFGEYRGTDPPVRTLIFWFFSCFPAEILQANDKLTQALGRYRQVVASHENGGGGGSATSSADAAGKEHPAEFHDSSAPACHV